LPIVARLAGERGKPLRHREHRLGQREEGLEVCGIRQGEGNGEGERREGEVRLNKA